MIGIPKRVERTTSTYDDLFAKAVTHVTNRWVNLTKALATDTPGEFLASLANCDLDTGMDIQTGRLVCWA